MFLSLFKQTLVLYFGQQWQVVTPTPEDAGHQPGVAADEQDEQQHVDQAEAQVAEGHLADLHRIDVEPDREKQPDVQALGDEAFVAIGAFRTPGRLENLVEVGEERVAEALPHLEHPEAAGQRRPGEHRKAEHKGQQKTAPQGQRQPEKRRAQPHAVYGKRLLEPEHRAG